MYVKNYLKHYGIVGMKWGVRRAMRNDSNYRLAKKQYDRDFNAVYKAGRKTKSFAITKKGKEKQEALQKDYNKKLNKAKDSANKLEVATKQAKSNAIKKMYTEKGYDKDTAKRISKVSTGKAAVQAYLMGSYGALKYNESRSKGAKRVRSYMYAAGSSLPNYLTLGYHGRNERKINQTKYSESRKKKNR